MTLDELKDLHRLLEKAQAHAEQQAAYTPNSDAADYWRMLFHHAKETTFAVCDVINMISEAMTYED